MQDLNEGDTVRLDTDSFDTNGKVGRIIHLSPGTTAVRVLLEDGNSVVVSTNQLTKQKFLSE
jgi:hypothetical protein